MPSYVDVCASGDAVEGRPFVVSAQSRALAIVRVEGVVYALDNVCPHRAGELGLGDVQGHHLYCPLHAWCFDVRTGVSFFPVGLKQECFEVAERAGRVWVRRAP